MPWLFAKGERFFLDSRTTRHTFDPFIGPSNAVEGPQNMNLS